MGLTETDRQLLTEAYQRAKERQEQHEQNLAHHQRRNDLLMELEGECLIVWDDQWIFDYRQPNTDIRRELTAGDLRIIADELDRRNKQ